LSYRKINRCFNVPCDISSEKSFNSLGDNAIEYNFSIDESNVLYSDNSIGMVRHNDTWYFNEDYIRNLNIPLKIHLDVTDNCNLSCKHCYYYEENNLRYRIKNQEKVNQIVERLVKLKIPEIELLGGEPLLFKRFKKNY
jgi:sulfatase maturation enzyme AslB (radical SAM superfamily)